MMLKKTIVNPCLIYSLLWMMYYFQGSLYQSSMIGALFMGAFILWSLYYCIKVNVTFKLPPFIKGVNWMVVLFTIYGIIRILSTEVIYRETGVLQSPTIFLKNSYISLLPIYGYFWFYRKGYFDDKWINRWIIIFVIYAILRYIFFLRNSLGASTNDIDLTNNAGYIFVALMCLLPFVKKNINKYIFLVIIALFILSSIKRGAIICFAACAFYWIISNIKSSQDSFRTILNILFSSVILLVVFNYAAELYQSNSLFAEKISSTVEGDSSGRDDIQMFFINNFFADQSLLHFLFGNGADGTIKLYGQFAHNDWIEMLVNHGLLGIFCYIAFYYFYLKNLYLISNRVERQAVILCLITFLLKSIWSMSITDIQICQSVVLVYCFTKAYDTRVLTKTNN